MAVGLILPIISCSKKTESAEINREIPGKGNPEPDDQIRSLIPLLITEKNYTMKLYYTTARQLRAVSYAGDSTAISYNSKLLAKEISHFRNGVLTEQALFVLNATGTPQTMEHYTVQKNARIFKANSRLDYDSQQRLTEATQLDAAKKVLSRMTFRYAENGSFQISKYPENTVLYFNDQEGNPLFKEVKNAWIFGLEGLHPFFFSNSANWGGKENKDPYDITYSYNRSLFPQTIQWKSGTQTTNMKVTFTEIYPE
ncbi:hypothetical protein [Pedobacter antarcticus]|uniref:hypothetical protein n=1 Tax=Pedobacter antarcticus TaxID=34086 RepID=UPI001C5A3A0B|nr:hypothetical protein [Pedobacter antarcticus]